MKRKFVQKVAAYYLLGLVFYGWGMATVAFEWFPYNLLKPVARDVLRLRRVAKRQGGWSSIWTMHQMENPSPYAHDGLLVRDSSFEDPGYLLLPSYRHDAGHVVTELIELKHGKVLHRWTPDLDQIFESTPLNREGVNTRQDYRMQHPLLMPNGDLIFSSGLGPLVRIRPDGSVVWTLDHLFHHGSELDGDGNLLVPIQLPKEEPYAMQDQVGPLLNDGIAWVSPEGELIRTVSLMRLFVEAKRFDLLFGIGLWEEDRFHLNNCEPQLVDGPHAKAGDVLLSVRNLSVIANYRPSEDRLVWIQNGPWLNQHDINPMPDGRYSLLGNNVARYGPNDLAFITRDGVQMDVYLYNPETEEVETPWAELLMAENVRSTTQSRSRVLPNGDLVIEPTNQQRILRMSENVVRWEYVSASRPGIIGDVYWSRYYLPEEVDLTFLSSEDTSSE